MPRITLVGAGSVVFTRDLCNDFLLTPALQGSTIVLMDIDPDRLERSREMVQALIDRRGLKARLESTSDRRAAVHGADYVITVFQQGGLTAHGLDIEIPQRYGVEQCIGDTLGPGGVFRALRTIPVLLDLCHELDEVAPRALLINYVNPMAANCWAVDRASGRPHVGLCHSVQGTSEMLARWVGVSYNEVTFRCAGINHQAFFLEFRRGAQDLYPLIRQAVERPEVYAEEPVRVELLKHFGYFVTESSAHASEYVPYFRKNASMVNEDLVPRFASDSSDWFDCGRTGGYLRKQRQVQEHASDEFRALVDGQADLPSERSNEYCSFLLEALETHRPIRINANVPNRGLIPSLPGDCCIEVPCLVDANGVQPTRVLDYPPQLAALNRTGVNVQSLIVEAAVSGNVDAVYHAVMLDPLTAAACTLPQIHEMVSEMLAAEAQWLPQFRAHPR